MRVPKGFSRCPDDLQRFLLSGYFFGIHMLFQRWTREKLHGEIMPPVDPSRVVDGHYIGMVELGKSADFLNESRCIVLIMGDS